jgi:putative oxidoreductase
MAFGHGHGGLERDGLTVRMSNGAAWGVLLLRVVLGVVLIMHGYLAFAITGVAATAAYMPRLGVPPALATPLAWYLIVVHAVGGALIVAGLWTRLAALLNVPVLACAAALIHWPQGFFMKGAIVDAATGRARAIGYEFALLVLACTVAVALIGGGPLSLDRVRQGAPRAR